MSCQAKLGRPRGNLSVPVLVRRQEIDWSVRPESSDLLQVVTEIGGERGFGNQRLLLFIPSTKE